MGFLNKLFGTKKPATVADPDMDSRERLYSEVFGPIATVFHETEQRGAHIDVYKFDPREGRDFFTYATGGMSTLDQPGLEGDDMARTELVFYSTSHSPLYPELLRNFAHYPFETGAAIAGWDTVPLGAHAERALGSARFQTLWFCAATRKEDMVLVPRLTTAGHTVYPMMIVPLTDPEFSFLSEHGVQEFLARISASPVSVVFDPSRESVL